RPCLRCSPSPLPARPPFCPLSLTALPSLLLFFFFTHPPPPDTSPLSLHDALPISPLQGARPGRSPDRGAPRPPPRRSGSRAVARSEEHTSELQSLTNLVCRLLLEKKKTTKKQQSRCTSTTTRNTPRTRSEHIAPQS